MTTYQDVVLANLPYAAWALVEASGTDFAPFAGAPHLTGSGTFLYQQTSPTSPFGFAVHLATNAKLLTPTAVIPANPNTVEVWMKLDTYPPPAITLAFYWGDSAANGNGVYIDTSGNITYYAATKATVNTGSTLGSGWHLIQLGNVIPGTIAIAKDGIIIWQQAPTALLAASPTSIGFGSSPTANAGSALSLAWPALYSRVLDANLAKSNYLALTNPDAALAFTPGASSANQALLNKLLGYVSKTYQN